MHESRTTRVPRLTSTFPVAVRSDRSTSTPAGRNAQIAVIRRGLRERIRSTHCGRTAPLAQIAVIHRRLREPANRPGADVPRFWRRLSARPRSEETFPAIHLPASSTARAKMRS